MSARFPAQPIRAPAASSASTLANSNSAAARRLNRLSKGAGQVLDEEAKAAIEAGQSSKTILISRNPAAAASADKRSSGRKQIPISLVNSASKDANSRTLPKIKSSASSELEYKSSGTASASATPRSPAPLASSSFPSVNTNDSKPHPHINFTFKSRNNSIDRSSQPVQSQSTSALINSLAANNSLSPDPADFYNTNDASPTNSGISFDGLDEGEFEDLDEQVLRSASFRELHRLIRMCASQPSCDRMVLTIERQARGIIGAAALRLFLVQRDGMVHYSRPQPFPLSGGIAGYTRTKREIVNLTNPSTDERFLADVDQMADRPAATAYMCVAVEADSKADGSGPRDVVAVLQCFKERDGESFSTRDCKVMYRLSEFIGNMLRSSRSADRAQALYNASLQGHKRSAALLDVAKALASETGLDRIVSIIVSQVPELLDSDRCTLFFVDRPREELIVTKGASKGRHKNLVSWIFGQCNAPELPFPKGQNELRLSTKNGVAGHVAMTGETVNIIDAHQDPRFNSTMDKETGYRTRSLLCVPMIDSAGVIIGVVQAINKNPLYGRFDQQDETLLKTFSAQAALAVRNSQLFHKTHVALQQSDALLEVTKALSQELKIEALISIICSKVQALLNAERCTVFIVDKERKELYTSETMSYGMGPSLPIDHEKTKLISFPMNRGIVGSVATSGQSVNIPDAYKDERFNKAMDKETGYRTRSILCTAISNHRNEIVGVVQVMNKRDGTFNEDDENLLSAFCAQAAVAIENSRLFQQTEKALNHALADQRNLKFMLSVTKNLFSDMHLTSMIDQMTMQVHHLLKADDCALYLVDDAKKEFWLAKDDSVNHDAHHRFPYGTGIVGVVALNGETVRISSGAHADPRFSPLVDQRKGKVTHSILCCPIQSESSDGESKVVGVISVRDEKDRGGFEQEEEKLLKVFCAQAAVAIMNSKRFSSIMEQSEIKESDHSAADYLKSNRGMKLASDDINSFQFTSDEIKLKGAIGTGSYGEVYRAIVKNKIVAVKKLHVRNLKAEQVDAFCKEASLMCQLDHRNIVGFIGAVTEPSNLCIITEYCSRGSLADLLLEDNIDMNFRCKIKLALDAAQGMLYLHNSNPVILHRDLKSDNLLVEEGRENEENGVATNSSAVSNSSNFFSHLGCKSVRLRLDTIHQRKETNDSGRLPRRIHSGHAFRRLAHDGWRHLSAQLKSAAIADASDIGETAVDRCYCFID